MSWFRSSIISSTETRTHSHKLGSRGIYFPFYPPQGGGKKYQWGEKYSDSEAKKKIKRKKGKEERNEEKGEGKKERKMIKKKEWRRKRKKYSKGNLKKGYDMRRK